MFWRRKLRWFGMILLILVGESAVSAPEAQMDSGMSIPEAVSIPKFYSEADFYFLEKDGRRTPLVLYSKALVVRFKPVVYEPAQRQDFFNRMGWNKQDISVEKLKAVIGAEEVKRSLTIPVEVFVITFASPQKIVSLLNQAVDDPGVGYAAPVFWRKEDLVFPAGIWLQAKYFDQGEPENLLQSIREQGYDRLPISPETVSSPRLYYYYKDNSFKKGINPLQLSRAAAQSVWALWSVPDFVSIKPFIRVAVDLLRPSGVLGQTFAVHYRLRYDPKKIVVDTDDLQKIDAFRLRPPKIGNGLFRMDPVSLDSRIGEILLKVFFQVYQPGDFSLPGLKIFYAFNGVRKDLPPENIVTDDLLFKVVGFVPRDDKGIPSVFDIFGWKKEKSFSVVEPAKPVSETYPNTDLRFWTKSWYKQYPWLGMRLRQISFVFWLVAFLFMGGPVFRFAVRKIRINRKSPYRVFVKAVKSGRTFLKNGVLDQERSSHILQAGKAFLRNMVGLPEGKTDREILESAVSTVRPSVEKLLFLLNSDAYKRGFLDEQEIAVLKKNMVVLKRILFWQKKLDFLGLFCAKIKVKIKFWQEV